MRWRYDVWYEVERGGVACYRGEVLCDIERSGGIFEAWNDAECMDDAAPPSADHHKGWGSN